jgi:magnesium-transporting ATPase (P-type)
MSNYNSLEPNPAIQADSLPTSPGAHHQAFLTGGPLCLSLEASSSSHQNASTSSAQSLNNSQVQRKRQDSLTIPQLSSTVSFDSLLPSPSSDGGDMVTLPPSISIGASWTSSRSTLPVDDESERILPAKAPNDHSSTFTFTPDVLARMFDPRSIELFQQAGGLAGLEKGLQTSLSAGLSQEECSDETTAYGTLSWSSLGRNAPKPFADRIACFGENRLPESPSKSFFQLLVIALSDKVLLLLSVVSIISLALGLYQAICQPHAPGQPRVEWAEGATIMAAVAIASIVGALNDYQKEQQFIKLNRKVNLDFTCIYRR